VTAIIDPVLDYNPNNAHVTTLFADKILNYIESHQLSLLYILETHAHADHLTSAAYLSEKYQAKVAIGKKITSVQSTFKAIFNLKEFKSDGSQFDLLMGNNHILELGKCQIKTLSTPGHTNDSLSYIVGDCVFIGDTLFSPDYGTARCDFPGGDAGKLYYSIQNIYALGEQMKLYLCHDYPPNNRLPQAWFVSAEQQANNIHINKNTQKDDFIAMRNKRDALLNQPRLIIPSIQVNIAAGHFPKPESNGTIYLKTPINVVGKPVN
jgi:glyoxylase-like metal-dependent hydrolase (beta-lactamase superfamily II)